MRAHGGCPERDVVREALLRDVVEALEQVASDVARANLDESISLTRDLGLDSVQMVDLAVALELRMGGPIPIEEWMGVEARRPGRAFTIASLISFISQLAERGVPRGID